MKCEICGKDQWKDLDYLRDFNYWYEREYLFDEKIDFCVCTHCGFLTYKRKPEEWYKARYEKERSNVTVNNIITTNRKIEYHKAFLNNKDDKFFYGGYTKVYDYGCAHGQAISSLFDDNTKISGCELNTKFSKYAINKHNVSMNPIDNGEKYDFIMMYHVLEHLTDPVGELKKCRDALLKDGKIYLSVPIWLDILHEASGSVCGDFENLYHLNHINCFTYNSIGNLFNKVGLTVVKENINIYGYTVLLEACEPVNKIIPESYKNVIETLEKQKEAINLFFNKNFKKAIEVYPNYPDAYIFESTIKENISNFQKRKQLFEEALSLMPKNRKLKLAYADLFLKWDESKNYDYTNNIKKAERIFEEINKETPNESALYSLGMINMRYKKDYSTAISYFKSVLVINPTSVDSVVNNIGYCYCNM